PGTSPGSWGAFGAVVPYVVGRGEHALKACAHDHCFGAEGRLFEELPDGPYGLCRQRRAEALQTPRLRSGRQGEWCAPGALLTSVKPGKSAQVGCPLLSSWVAGRGCPLLSCSRCGRL